MWVFPYTAYGLVVHKEMRRHCSVVVFAQVLYNQNSLHQERSGKKITSNSCYLKTKTDVCLHFFITVLYFRQEEVAGNMYCSHGEEQEIRPSLHLVLLANTNRLLSVEGK